MSMFFQDQMDQTRLVEIVESHVSGSPLVHGPYNRCNVYFKESKGQKPTYAGKTDLAQTLFSEPLAHRIGFLPVGKA